MFSLAFVDAPFRWTDPHTWPWLFYVWAAFLLFGLLKPAWVWFRREQAKSWPTASARIDSAHIAGPKRFLSLALRRTNTLDAILAYSFHLSGQEFRGEYRRTFDSEPEAHEFLRDLQGQHVPVQYDPDKPARSALLEETVETLLRNRPPAPNAAPDFLPSWLRPLLGPLLLLSLVGMVFSLWIHIGALLGRHVAPESLFWCLHIGIFAVFGPAVFIAQKRVGGMNRKDFWKRVTRGAPDGFRYTLYLLFLYVFVSSIPSFLHAPPGVLPARQYPALPDAREFSSIWMVFYWSAFVILYSAWNASRERPSF